MISAILECESSGIGDNNIVESKAFVGPKVKLSSGCVIGAMCELSAPETLPENTIIYGKDCSRRVGSEKPAVLNEVAIWKNA